MSFISIIYNEESAKEFMKYVSVVLSYGSTKKVFESGNFVKDWYDMRKFMVMELDNEPYHTCSSSVDHFIMDGAPYESAYLHMVDEKPVLKYFDKSDPNWYHDFAGIGKGIEFFVPEGTQPTWEELKNMCEVKN